MTDRDPRPIPGDPSAPVIESLIDVDQSWLMSAPGDYDTFAVEAMNRAGGNYQRLIALRWPARINKTDEAVTLRLLIDPADALGLADVLTHTATWLLALDAVTE